MMSATLSTLGDREIRIERIFNAPRERVWQAMADPDLVAQWWGRGNRLVIERMEFQRGGHWRYVEHTTDGVHGFEGRYREIVAPERIVSTFDWDGMPGHVIVNTMTLEDLGDGRTKLVTVSLLSSTAERDGMLRSDMAKGVNQSYAALDRVLTEMQRDGARPPRFAIKKVAFSMYPITDVARARKFYEETLGLAVGMAGGQGGMHWIEYDLPGGGCLALTNTTGERPGGGGGATVALEVVDLISLMERLKASGVAFRSDVIRGPHCRMAVCVDSEGNSLLLHQLDPDSPAC